MLHFKIVNSAYFENISDRNIVADIFRLDRPLQQGEEIVLQEYDSATKMYSGRELILTVTSIKLFDGSRNGIQKGFAFVNFRASAIVKTELPAWYTGLASEPKEALVNDNPNPVNIEL